MLPHASALVPAATLAATPRAARDGRRSTLTTALLLGALATPALPALPAAAATSAPALVLSTSSARTAPVPLDGRNVAGSAYVFVTPASAVRRVAFHVDDASASRTPYSVERTAPFDLAGGTDSRATAYDTGRLSPGRHTVTAVVSLAAGGTRTLTSAITVGSTTSTSTPVPSTPVPTTPVPSTPVPSTPVPTTPVPTTPVPTTPVPTTTNAAPPLRIAPVARGTRDGSSWADAGSLADLPRFIASRRAGGEIWVRGDAGTYAAPSSLAIRTGATSSSAPVVVRGVDAAGAATVRPVLVGDRTAPYSPTGTKGSTIFRLHTGATNLVFSNLAFRNAGTPFAAVGNAAGITVQDVTATNVRRFFENYKASEEASANLRGLTIRRVRLDGFSRSFLRVQYDSSGVLVEDVEADSQRQAGDDFAMGVHLDGTAHDVVLRRVAMRNSHSTSGSYWNGDGFATEHGVHGVRFEHTTATGSTDGGYDLKSSGTVLVDAVATDNTRNFRFWAKDTKVVGCSGLDPYKRGGSAGQAQVWLSTAARVQLSDCRLSDASSKTLVFDLGENAALTVVGGTVSRSSLSSLSYSRSGAQLNLDGVDHTAVA